MKKLFGVLFLSLVFLVQCGGADSPGPGASSSQEGDALLPFNAEIASGFKDAALTNTGTTVAVDAGFAANGTVIAIPDGFTADRCKFTAALATLDGSSLSAQASINHETGEVTCQKVVQERLEIPPEVQDCTASYTIICAQ